MAAHLAPPHADLLETTPFSLFDGDLVSRVFLRLGMASYRATDLIKRSLYLIGITWVPLTLLAIVSEVHWTRPPGQNFFMDVAAYGQLLVGLPMFLIAERVIDRQTREAARFFLTAGVVSPGDAVRLLRINWQLKQLRRHVGPDLVCLALGYVLTAAWMIPELYNDRLTWHAIEQSGNRQLLTWAGVWELGWVGPLTTYWWLRWTVKVGLWSWYLFEISKLRLTLVPSHPDRTGGIGFLSDAQTKFGWVILAYGVSYVAPTIAYKMMFEGATLSVLSVWGYAVGFVIGAPVLFTVPLFMFTRQLYEAKHRALERLQERSMERARAFEDKWLKACSSGHYELMSGSDLAGLNALNQVYDHIRKMRVVPFDLRSFTELLGSALGPMIPLLPYLIDIPEPWLKVIEEGKKLLR